MDPGTVFVPSASLCTSHQKAAPWVFHVRWRLGVRAAGLDPIVLRRLPRVSVLTSRAAPSFLPAGDSCCPHLVSVYPRQPEYSAFLVAGCVWNLPLPPSCLGSTLPFAPCSPHGLVSCPCHPRLT